MKTFISILILLSCIFQFEKSGAQTEVVFSYDQSGNRTMRTIQWEEEITDTIPVKDSTEQITEKTGKIDDENLTALFGEMKVSVYPNPTVGDFQVIVEGWKPEADITMTIYSMQGALVLESKILQARTPVSISSRKDGIYILSVIVDGKKEKWKMIKK